MNRQQRRAAAKQQRRAGYTAGHLDCGCEERWLIPLEEPVCPGCGETSSMIPRDGMPFPTSAPIGSVKDIEVGCGCGAEFTVVCAVD